jgi:prepilin-type N-terminal cleavage/methylation domain-containing protein
VPAKLAGCSWARAFTLIEVLIVIGVISILGGVSIAVIGGATESARVSKLENDVATINAAIQVYQASGGVLPSSPSPTEVLNKLKTKATAASGSKIAGFRGSVIDLRLKAEMLAGSDAGPERAVWDNTAQRFLITTTGEDGVKRFLLDDAEGVREYTPEDREQPNQLGDRDKWVWDYDDQDPSNPTGPAAPGTGTASGGTLPTTSGPQKLAMPTYSISPDDHRPLNTFDLTISISNPNPSGVSDLFYNAGGGYTRYTGPVTVAPGGSLTAQARTIDPDRWITSDPNQGTWTPEPVTPIITITAPGSMTYAEAGGAMTSGTTTAPASSVSITNLSEIPESYRSTSTMKINYTLDNSNPLAANTQNASFGTVPVPLSVASWGTATSLPIKAIAKSSHPYFTNSEPKTSTVSVSPMPLGAPTIDPPSGAKAVDLPVSIALPTGQPLPVGARIYYTVDGTDLGDLNGSPTTGTLYTGQFNSGAGTNGVVVVKARVYGPEGRGQWFSPSPVASNTYASITLADGALVGSANLNGTFVGSLVYASPASGSMNSITFNANAKILKGNLYVPGTPSVRLTNGTVWATNTDSAFANYIQGWEFNSAGERTIQSTPRVLNENGNINPTNYSITFNSSAILEGKVIRRHNAPAFPTIAPPPPADSNGSISLNNPPGKALSSSQYANITINTSSVGDVRLTAGHYGNLTANNGTSFVLGDPQNPEVTQYYSFQSLNLNSGAGLKIVGKVVITVGNGINLNSGSVLGNADHPDWLQLQFSNGQLNANSGSTVHGQLVVPTGSVTFNAGSVFRGSVTAQTLTINSSGVVFNLPPVIQN